ncbi:MAG: ATP synthase F0 subunit B [Treponema sp.]|nr:ATP synthase F0 subunit B [Treponema sp.]
MLDFSVTFIITIVNIAILTFVLRALLFKPVTKFMAERAKKVQNTIAEAGKDRAAAQKLLEQYQAKVKDAKDEADQIIGAGRKNAEAEAERIIADARERAHDLTETARKQIESERQAMATQFKLEAAALIMAASARLVQRELSGDDNRRYANMLFDELNAQKGSL